MTDTVIVAIISLLGTLGGSLLGIIAANKLTTYRIEQLEKKVDKHNQVIERVFNLEKEEAVIKEELDNGFRRIQKLEKYHEKP